MNKKYLLISLALLFLSSSIFAQYSAIESFNYAVGTSIDTLVGDASNGWAGAWNRSDVPDLPADIGLVADEGLDYLDLNYEVPNVGQHVKVSNPGGWVASQWDRYLDKTWPDEAGTSYWVSFLFQADSVPTGNTYYILKLFKDATELVAFGKGGGGTTYTCGSGWPGGAGDDVSATECVGGPIWMVAKINMSGDAEADRTYMWIDPDPSVEPDTASADVKRNSDMNDGFNFVRLECGGEDVMGTHWDEIRLGTSFEEVSSEITPELYAIESFDYDIGTSIDTLVGDASNGWAGAWNRSDVPDLPADIGLIADEGLNYLDLNYEVPNIGNHVKVSNPGGWVASQWDRYLASTWPDDGSSYWMSFLFQADSVPTGNTYYILKLFKDATELVAVGKGGGGTTYTCGSGWPGGAGDDVSATECVGGPIWMVMKVDMSGDDSSERTFMWIDPDPSVEPDTASADVKRNSDMNDGFNFVRLECGGEDVMGTHWDEIRLGTSFEDVSSIITHVVNYDVEIPETFSLKQNYPNPFNPTTQIEFHLSKQSNVTLAVYDVLGREVSSIITNEIKPAGLYSVAFDATSLTSGIYFYTIRTDQFVQTKKMMLVK